MTIRFEDYEGNPILEPAGEGFDTERVYNPAVIIVDGVFYMLYRAEGEGTGTGAIGLAKSEDGIHFTRHSKPVIVPEHDYEAAGCEDPRIVRFGDTYRLTYVGGSDVGHICLASSKDLLHWKKHGPILEPAHSWDSHQVKAGVIVPGKVNGKYVMYFTGEERPWETSIGIAYSDDLLHWHEPLDEPVLKPRLGHFDSKGVETGTNPVLISEGILMVYSGWAENCVYQAGAVLFSKEEPTKVLWRSEKSLLEPMVNWGKHFGCTNHVVAESLLWHKERFWLYYGAADKVCCLATMRFSDVSKFRRFGS
jgi:predicted GH43/DUF377 family glycosyl hydrolase